MAPNTTSDLDGVDDVKLKEGSTLHIPVSSSSLTGEKDQGQRLELSTGEKSHEDTQAAPFKELFRYEHILIWAFAKISDKVIAY